MKDWKESVESHYKKYVNTYENISSFIFHISSFIFHLSSFIFHISSFIFHLSYFIFHISSLFWIWNLNVNQHSRKMKDVCYWSVGDGDFGLMLQYLVHTFRQPEWRKISWLLAIGILMEQILSHAERLVKAFAFLNSNS